MSERERPSLTGLAIKRPLLDRGKPVVSFDEAETALLGENVSVPDPAPAQAPARAAAAATPKAVREADLPATQLASPLSVQPTVQSTVLSPSLLKARRKEIKIAWTFKIPHALHQELSAVAAHNSLTMSDIVIEAIRFHLPNFPHPPQK